MTISKNIVVKAILIVWIFFSVAYICWDVWSDFRIRELTQAYQQGRIEVVNALIEQAKQCEPIPVSSGDQQIQVINFNCLEGLGSSEK